MRPAGGAHPAVCVGPDTFTFTFTHLADAFIQSDLHCIQVTVFTFLSALAFHGNRTHDLGVANAMLYQLSYRKATPQYMGCIFGHPSIVTGILYCQKAPSFR